MKKYLNAKKLWRKKMKERIIETLIKKANEKESNAHGSNKKCFLIDDYALLQQMFTVDEITKIQVLPKLISKNYSSKIQQWQRQ